MVDRLNKPARSEWPRISNEIASRLEKDGRDWFANVVENFKRASARPEAQKIGPAVLQTELSGYAEIAVKAFQLIVMSRLMGAYSYLPYEEGREFADLVWAQVCGTRLKQVIETVRYYTEGGNYETEVSRFATDITEHISGDTSVFSLMMGVTM